MLKTFLLCAAIGSNLIDDTPNQDKVLIDFENQVKHQTIIELGQQYGLAFSLSNSRHNIYTATVPEGAVPHIRGCNIPGIEAISEDTKAHAYGKRVANDPLHQFQWNFDQINLDWESQGTGKDVIVAVLDTGVTKVKDLSCKEFYAPYNAIDNSDNVEDMHGHGTHVSGTVAQCTGNKYGVAGVAPNATIMPVKVLGDNGSGSLEGIANGIYHAVDSGASIINMSLGGAWQHDSSITCKAIEYAHKNNVSVVVAAGNDGQYLKSDPAGCKKSFTVSATQFDKATTFYSNYHETVDIAAPGGNTRVDQNNDGRPDGILQEVPGEFALYQGTSMAAPHVAGALAIIYENGITTPDEAQKLLTDNAIKHNPLKYNEINYQYRYGAGVLNMDFELESKFTITDFLWIVFKCFLGLIGILFLISVLAVLLE